MMWKIVNNSEIDLKEYEFNGECQKHCKDAIVTVKYKGRKLCKTDSQKSYTEVERKCNLLLEIEKLSFAPCIENCPLIRKEII